MFNVCNFALKCKNQICIGLAPGRTSEVGQGQSQEKFSMVGRSVGHWGVGRRRAESDGSFYFFLELPQNLPRGR